MQAPSISGCSGAARGFRAGLRFYMVFDGLLSGQSTFAIHGPSGSAIAGGPDETQQFMAEGRYDFGFCLAPRNVGRELATKVC